MTRRLKKTQGLEQLSMKLTQSIGTPVSIVVHTILFIGIFALALFGITFENILLILTTLVSLEAIYLAIFIQMTVNRNTQALEGVEEDIEEIQEDVQDIEGDVDVIHAGVKEISSDVDEISKDVDEISEEVEDISEDIDKLQDNPELTPDQVRDISLDKIEQQLMLIMKELEELKKKTP